MDTNLYALENETAALERRRRIQQRYLRRTRLRRGLNFMLTLALVAGLLYGTGSSLMMPARQDVSAYLIDHAWARSLRGSENARPWPWINTSPVARLSIPVMRQDFVILRGTEAETLALAPGWNEGTNLPGEHGIALISSYGDTFFKKLKDLDVGDLMSLQTRSGRMIDYRVEAAMVLDEPEMKIDNAQDQSILILSTSYPYRKWQEGGDLRYVVVAREIPADHPLRLAGNGTFSSH